MEGVVVLCIDTFRWDGPSEMRSGLGIDELVVGAVDS